MGYIVPERPDDSAESFSAQQEQIAKDVQAALDARFDKELNELLDRENDS